MTQTSGRRGARLFSPGFVAIMVAQVFSLLGMEILQFVIPLHLLNLTGSGTLYGTVIALGNVPYLLLAPIGGVVADRTRKRAVMAACDLALAAALLGYLALSGSTRLVPLTAAVLMVAFAAQAIYQPCVQSSVPRVVAPERLEQAVAVTNQVSMLTWWSRRRASWRRAFWCSRSCGCPTSLPRARRGPSPRSETTSRSPCVSCARVP